MRELKDRSDLEYLIDTFYKDVIADITIGSFFTEVIKLDWEKHIPVMIDFWETVLFGGYKYKGNPMLVHMELDKKASLQPEHFKRWLYLWETTIKENFSGQIAAKAIEKAQTVSQVMLMRIKQNEDKSGLNIMDRHS
jgi:hemoglobin